MNRARVEISFDPGDDLDKMDAASDKLMDLFDEWTDAGLGLGMRDIAGYVDYEGDRGVAQAIWRLKVDQVFLRVYGRLVNHTVSWGEVEG